MLFNQVNPLSCMNRLNSLWEMGFGKSFPLASTMSKGLPWNSVDAQSLQGGKLL